MKPASHAPSLFWQRAVWSLCRRVRGRITRIEKWSIRRWVSKVAGVDVGQIMSYTSPAELAGLFKLVRELPRDARVLEMGSHLGASSCYIAAALADREGTLYCVDTWNNETMPEGQQDTMSRFSRHTRNFRGLIRPIRKRSDQLQPADLDLPVHMVFIDADHSYEGVRADFNRVCDWVLPKGVVAFHDACGNGFPGVARVIGEALASSKWDIGNRLQSLFWITRVPEPAGD